MIKVHCVYEDLPDEFNEYMLTLGEFWELIPGMGFIEFKVDTIEQIYFALSKAEIHIGFPVELAISILAPVKEGDDEEQMLIGVFRKAKSIF